MVVGTARGLNTGLRVARLLRSSKLPGLAEQTTAVPVRPIQHERRAKSMGQVVPLVDLHVETQSIVAVISRLYARYLCYEEIRPGIN